MTVWVDADACPVVVRDILFRAAERTGVAVTFVANQPLKIPNLRQVSFVQVPAGFDVADNAIVERVQSGDLVVTQDIPLAAEVMDKGAQALSPRGEAYTDDSIRQRLNMRDFLDSLRSSGTQVGGGPPPLGQRERQAFANHLDRYLAKNSI